MDDLTPELDELDDDAMGPVFEPDPQARASTGYTGGRRNGAAEPDLTDALGGDQHWHASRISSLLQAKGALLHGALAVDKGTSQEWLYTKADLDAIAPPLSRIMNRYPATRAAAAGGDELAVAVGFAGYAARSWSERRAAQQLHALLAENHQPQPETVAAAAAAVPDPEPTPMATTADLEWPAEGEPPPIAGRR